MLESKDYYIDLINSSKANKFTEYWHYSGVGFKKAKINQGIFRKTDNLLVGVLQWGISAQEGIRLDRYVKEPITKEQYLELNRFCMADSERRNAESQAIALGIKWIKKNRPDIKLLVSYAGRKEGNYGYIYQATNWEYLGYFVSPGFWLLDGEERHQITVWFKYKKYGDPNKSFTEGVCDLYTDVRQTWTKQFIYIQRLDKTLTCASEVLPYPKETTDAPICVRTRIYKENPDLKRVAAKREPVQFYWEKEKYLFGRRAMIRQGTLIKNMICMYYDGEYEESFPSVSAAARACGLSHSNIDTLLKNGKQRDGYSFLRLPSNVEPPEEMQVVYLCEIDGLRFYSQQELAAYCGVTPQGASISYVRKSKTIGGKKVTWYGEKDVD